MAAAALAQEAQQMPFIKNLASSDRKLRTASLSSLQAFLASRTALSPLDSRKLWTGLYYALWMTDRPRPQQALAADLAALLFALPPACAREWLAGFWAVLGAQWPHIEALRLDKFMLLARRVFAVHVRFARERGFAPGKNSSSNGEGDGEGDDVALAILREWCFDAEDRRGVALGLRLHVLDVWVDELEREGALAAAAATEEQDGAAAAAARGFVTAVGAMVEELARKSPNKAIRERARQSFEDERLPWVDAKEHDDDEEGDDDDDEEGDDDDEWGGLDD
ncbi:Ribosomal RNA-processing protein 1 -like protein [Escovopsis weberi]|uniref:Ribosomal RNA-processing protein 1-like protein n=1 Tax=Escovopsis weberi TaxID=150374 RepID=A0A0M8N8U5_ESCWE|nr:Ribosomal RNA-processing protein 1 -like protein [Escovopsis weberi]